MLPFIFGSPLDFSSMDAKSSTISFEGSKNSSDSSENGGNFQESFAPVEGFVGRDRKRKKMNQEEGFINSNMKLRTVEGRNEGVGSLRIDTNEMSFYGGDQSDLWTYVMASQDLNHLTFKVRLVRRRDRTGQNRTGQDRTGQDRCPAFGKLEQHRTGQAKTC
ncbi:hypothetical protein OSB04_009548 [Centaurea solstitialis]|uniref:Uncharacterized protein n=1 Tax=Centaurea solstitialis TaxID=347529 RepID=A0AA38T7H7_9ASTR|nr:hypothetical protein OSB04_009548 [Centaurea solstitialis]